MSGDTALVLANAVYFKGKWAKQFDPKATTDRPFHVDANTVKQVPTMFRKGNYKYAELAEYDAKCIELPYAVMLLSRIFEKDLIKRLKYFAAFPQVLREFVFMGLIFIIAEQRGQYGNHSTQ